MTEKIGCKKKSRLNKEFKNAIDKMLHTIFLLREVNSNTISNCIFCVNFNLIFILKYSMIKLIRRVKKMIELEENKRKLVELKSRLEGVGESL